MSYRQKIIELAKSISQEVEKNIVATLKKDASEHELMMQYQTLREIIAEEAGGGDTSFDVNIDGKPKKFKNLQEWNDFVAKLPQRHQNVSVSTKYDGSNNARRIRRKL